MKFHLHTSLLLIVLLSSCFWGHGQTSYRLSNDIPVYISGSRLINAWAGGLNDPQFSDMDLDGDGKKDLVIYDREDGNSTLGIFHTFLNKGTTGTTRYEYAPEYGDSLPDSCNSWALMRDFDRDGHADCYCGTSSSKVLVYRNVKGTTGKLEFDLIRSPLNSEYGSGIFPIYAPRNDINVIDDIDGDQDLDMLAFDTWGSYVTYHRNMSVEMGYGFDSLIYVVKSDCFGHFLEDASSCDAYVNDTPCPGESATKMESDYNPWDFVNLGGRHSGSSMVTINLDADSLKELIVGDVSCNEFYWLRNRGSRGIAHFDTTFVGFPEYDTIYDVYVWPAGYYLDINNDNVKDFIAAPNEINFTENYDGVWSYLNFGATDNPNLKLEEKGFMQNIQIDVGSGASPAFFDHNADGLPDLLIGNQGYFGTPIDYEAALSLYENTGTASSPEFTLVDADYLSLRSDSMTFGGLEGTHPALGDLDGDGDIDLLIGDVSGDLLYFENIAGAGATASFTFVSSTYSGINVGGYSAPALYDLDNDTDLDLLIGNQDGWIHFYENQGSASSPVFNLVTDKYGFIKITDISGAPFTQGFSKPFVSDHDSDGDPDLLVGTLEGHVNIYENITTSAVDTFHLTTQLGGGRDFGGRSTVAALELDAATGMRYFIGTQRGGLHLWAKTALVNIDDPVAQGELDEVKVFPNPANDQLTITQPGLPLQLDLVLYDLQGRKLMQGQLKSSKATFSISHLPSGMYMLQLFNDKYRKTSKVIIQH